MNIIEALKTELPLRRKGKNFHYINHYGYSSSSVFISSKTWISPEFLLTVIHLTKDDILATDWQVKKLRKKSK